MGSDKVMEGWFIGRLLGVEGIHLVDWSYFELLHHSDSIFAGLLDTQAALFEQHVICHHS